MNSLAAQRQCLGYNYPSLCPEEKDSVAGETVIIDLPEYEARRTITARDPLCCVYAFHVTTRVVLPALYGFRMCPECQHCATGDNPCMDFFGSNATPMGGAAGRGDAMIAAIEAQKAEGVLHIHALLYFQTLAQFSTLLELGKKLQEGLLSAKAMKEYISYTRCASYPSASKFVEERADIEKTWPAYADDLTLSRLPGLF